MSLIKNRHAVCLVGENAEALEEKALEQARLLLCSCSGAEICNSCIKAQNNVHPDIIRVREMLCGGKYGIDGMRAVITDSARHPNDTEYKVYIFAGADELSHICQNALLKFIEEPPEYVRIIFTARTSELFLETIKSRVMFIDTETEKLGSSAEMLEIAREFVGALMKNSEYGAAAALSKIKKRDELSAVTELISAEMRAVMLSSPNMNAWAEALDFMQSSAEDLRLNPNIALFCTYITAGAYAKISKQRNR